MSTNSESEAWTHEMIEIENEKIANDCGVSLAEMKNGDWRNTFTGLLKCVECGERQITTPIYKFYNWDARLVTCYECQDNNRKNV